MARFLSTITRQFFVISNFVTVIIFLIACLAGYSNPVTYFYIALLGVGFLFITIALVIFFIILLLYRSKWALLSLAALLIGWVQIHALFAFNISPSFSKKKPAGSFRVLTWNVSRWDEMNKQSKGGTSDRLKMFEYIKSQDPDIVCIQEFFESRMPELFDVNIPYFTRQLNYPYYIFANDFATFNGAYEHGVALFSRYPIVDTFRLQYQGSDPGKPGESLIRATIDVNGKRINVYTTHLQSFRFTDDDYRNISHIKRADDTDSIVEVSKGIIAKFKRSYSVRSRQAVIVKEQLDKSPYPEIICGDFNDVPNSYTYFTIKADRQDVFVKKGFGLGRTFVGISPTLRIDYILADKGLALLQYNKTRLPYSDHLPLIADFAFP
ncbi:MAG: endonuclease/exonuclease/phosphatase family protein [Chitinophagaceae bacterium]